MSRAGKFIPGGGGGKASRKSGPIRAPEPSKPGTPETPGTPKKGLRGLVKPVAKNQKMPIAIMSAIVCCLLVSVGWYTLAYLPAQRQIAEYKRQLADQQAREAQEQAAEEKAKEEALAAAATARGILTVDSNPTGALVTIGDFRKTTPAKFTDIVPGTFSVLVHMDGYEDYKQDVTVTADQPTDLGTITLVQKSGNLSITSPQSNVNYKLTGPNNYEHDGSLPDRLTNLALGDYSITVTQGDWTLPPITVVIHDHDNLTKDIKFPYATVNITSVPSGATVRESNTVLGQTPVVLSNFRPRDLNVTVDLPPYTLQRISIHVPDFGNVNKQVVLQQDKDFVSAAGIAMVWIPDGGYWAGKYLVRQVEFQTITGYNPSTFRKPNRPVETLSWDEAMAFCDKLNQFEKKAGKLPAGFHYTLPTEAQWEFFSADANIDLAAMSRASTLASTQDVGASEPNKYGLYDTLGNVWEWCLDNYDDKGDHTLRGGSWLSSPDNFPSADTRNGAAAKYSDRFTGFRVVCVPDK